MSADRNAEYLAHYHRANIVISTSAMKVLVDNHGPNFDKEWDIPVEVKSYAEKSKTLLLFYLKSHIQLFFSQCQKQCYPLLYFLCASFVIYLVIFSHNLTFYYI